MNTSMRQLPTIGDIQTTELLYYDADYSAECYRFCEERDIDCLPDASNPGQFYRRRNDESSFDQENITDEQRLDAATYIFQPGLERRFAQNPVLFVFTNGVLTGVVHFSDYNSETAYTYLYAEFYRYERDLRELLANHGLKNEDMRVMFAAKVAKYKDKPDNKSAAKTVEVYSRKLQDYDDDDDWLAKLSEFQGFYLDDLRVLASKRNVIKLSDITNLRNAVMHARDSVKQTDARALNFIYEYQSFKIYFELVLQLLTDRRRVHTRLLLKRGGDYVLE